MLHIAIKLIITQVAHPLSVARMNVTQMLVIPAPTSSSLAFILASMNLMSLDCLKSMAMLKAALS